MINIYYDAGEDAFAVCHVGSQEIMWSQMSDDQKSAVRVICAMVAKKPLKDFRGPDGAQNAQ